MDSEYLFELDGHQYLMKFQILTIIIFFSQDITSVNGKIKIFNTLHVLQKTKKIKHPTISLK